MEKLTFTSRERLFILMALDAEIERQYENLKKYPSEFTKDRIEYMQSAHDKLKKMEVED